MPFDDDDEYDITKVQTKVRISLREKNLVMYVGITKPLLLFPS